MSDFPVEQRHDAEQTRLRELLTSRDIHLGESALIVCTGHRGHPFLNVDLFLPEGLCTMPISDMERISDKHRSTEGFLKAVRETYTIRPR